MTISHRFARLRDGTLRLRLVALGEEDRDALVAVWPGVCRFRPVEEPEWRAQVTVTGDEQLDRFLDALEGTDITALTRAAERLRVDRSRLSRTLLRRQSAPAAGPVADDAVLRSLVHELRPRAAEGDLVFDELGILGGVVRADVAALTSGEWTGWELKGERDSLARLPGQVAGYGAVFDRCELVTTEHHLAGVLAVVPDWWTVRVAVGTLPGPVTLELVRPGGLNPAPDAYGRAQLLWRDETLSVLRSLGMGTGLSKATRDVLWDRLAAEVSADDLKPVVLGTLRRRLGWREPHSQ